MRVGPQAVVDLSLEKSIFTSLPTHLHHPPTKNENKNREISSGCPADLPRRATATNHHHLPITRKGSFSEVFGPTLGGRHANLRVFLLG